jgi:hypothetical protein
MPYAAALSVEGGAAPFTWRVLGGTLPPGLTLATSGDLDGTPTATGVFSFSALVTDANGKTASASYSVAISPAAPTPAGGATVSGNWSGYAIPSTTIVTEASGRFTVPALNCAYTPTAGTSIWTGIGGFTWPDSGSSGVLLQTGVETNCVGGAQRNYGWFEEYPSEPNQEERFVGFPVGVGDKIVASVFQTTSGAWETRVDDLNTGLSGVMITGEGWGVMQDSIGQFRPQGFTVGLSYAGGYTAEWIVEDATGADGSTQVPFADYGSVTFSGLTTSLSPWSLTPAEEVVMVQNGRLVSQPSAPESDGFSVTYTG